MSKNVNIKLGANIQDFQSKMKLAQKGFKKTAASLKKTGKALTMSLTAPLTAFAAASVKAFDTQAQAEAKLSRSLNGNMKAFRRLKKEAQELQKVTLFGDEETMAAQAMLTSMGLEEEAVKRLTPLIQDMATTKGMDLRAAADLVAKSVGSSTNALTRYGVEITGAVGSQERLETAVKGLSKQFEGQARSAAKAGAGGLKQLANRFGDIMEKIGEMLMPLLNGLVKFLDKTLAAWENLDGGLKIAIVTLGGVLAAIGPMVTLFGTLVSVVGFFMSPLGAVVAGLAALTAAVIYVVDNMQAFKERFSDVGWWKNALVQMLQWFIEFNPYSLIIKGFNKVLDYFGKEPIGNPFENMAEGLEQLKVETKDYKTEFGSFTRAISNAATKTKESLFGLGSGLGVGGQLSAAQTGENSTASGSVNLIEMDVDEMQEEAEVIDTTYGSSLVALKEKTLALRDATKEFGYAMANDFAGSFANAVVSGENFLVSMGQIFKDLAKQIMAMIVKAAVLAALFSFTGLGGAKAAGGSTDFIGLLTGSLTGKASGGSVVAGQPYMVGEKGPEMFMPNQSGTIIPNQNVGGGAIIPDVRITGDDLLIVFDRANRRKERR
tara:strand:+ start:5321 stop:7135 length:1815 start_codon:yes stop_codon:yes gene_type:complete